MRVLAFILGLALALLAGCKARPYQASFVAGVGPSGEKLARFQSPFADVDPRWQEEIAQTWAEILRAPGFWRTHVVPRLGVSPAEAEVFRQGLSVVARPVKPNQDYATYHFTLTLAGGGGEKVFDAIADGFLAFQVEHRRDIGERKDFEKRLQQSRIEIAAEPSADRRKILQGQIEYDELHVAHWEPVVFEKTKGR